MTKVFDNPSLVQLNGPGALVQAAEHVTPPLMQHGLHWGHTWAVPHGIRVAHDCYSEANHREEQKAVHGA